MSKKNDNSKNRKQNDNKDKNKKILLYILISILSVVLIASIIYGRILIKTEIEKNQNRGNEHNLKLHSIQTQYEEPPEARSNHA